VACGKDLGARTRPGDILLLHDDKPHVLDVLDVLLPQLAARGFDLGSAVGGL
jgi:hypothetical protein